MLISDLISERVVDVQTQFDSKALVFERLVELAENADSIRDRSTVLKSLIEREEVCSTAIGKEVAIPHPRDGIPGAFQGVAVSAVTVKDGLDLDAPDRLPVRLFFLVGAEDRRHHLHILGKLARILRSNDLRAKLISASTPDEFISHLKTAEHALNGR